MNWSKGGPSGKRGFGFGGFSLGGAGGGGGKKEELHVPQKSHTSFGGAGTAGGYGKNQQLPAFYKIGTKRANFDEENAYFEDDEEESSSTDLPYIPAENSPTRQQFQSGGGSDSEDDPLDAFMAQVEVTRGLDIPSIRTVVNYDVARDIDTHTHRIGRTGRAGEKGVAYTLLTSKDTSFAGDLVRNLEGANQSVSKELMDLAMQNPWFRKSRFKGGKGKKLNIGGGGLGYRERPGLGAESSERSGGAAMGNYEGYSKPTGAMGDRMSAMKSAFQSQYKNHFVAASGMVPKLTTKSSSSSGWTSAGSLSSVPTGAPEGPDRPRGPPSLTMAPPAALSMGPRDRHGDERSRHGDGHYRDRRDRSERHSGGGERDRYGERDRHVDRDRYGDKDRHGSSGRHGDSRNGEGSRRDRDEGRGDRAEAKGDREEDSFAVPDPPKRKKSRWDN
uniref:DEAD (Asp-Glu-Ala-Asp) box helicase 42 n=1 Tax=Oncorhynchus kisutch TaxID=8019 RepID=A0A8C7IRF5_ONCKI